MTVKRHGVNFDITAQDNATRAFLAVENSLKGVNKAAAAVGNALRGAFVATAVISVGRFVARAAIEAEQASKRLDAVLKATGHSAGITKHELDELADSMQESLGVDDEAVRNAASNLLKFGNIHGDVFREALKLSADLAAFMGTDMSAAAQMLGKSVQSPTEGLMMMERNFGKLTDAEEKHINSLVRQGKAIESQNAVLDLWREKIGGTAALMNTGLTKASKDVANAWDDMLQEMGRTEAVGGRIERALGGLASLLRDIGREASGVRTPLSQLAKDQADWAASLPGGLGALGRLSQKQAEWMFPSKGGASTEEERLRRWEDEFGAAQGRWLAGKPKLGGSAKEDEKAKQRLAKQLHDAEKVAKHQLEGDEEAATHGREAWEFYTKGRLEQEEGIRKAREEGLKSYFDTIDMEQERALEEGEAFLEAERARKEALKDSEQAARDLGLAFKSAFEDAIVEGKEFSGVLKALGQDVARIIVRKNITEPLGTAFSEGIKGIDWFGGIKEFFGFGREAGGGVPSNSMFEVAEHGRPEVFSAGGRSFLMTGNQVGTVSAAGSVAGGGGRYYIDARGADRTGLFRLEAMIRSINGSIEHRAVFAVADANRRGRRW